MSYSLTIQANTTHLWLLMQVIESYFLPKGRVEDFFFGEDIRVLKKGPSWDTEIIFVEPGSQSVSLFGADTGTYPGVVRCDRAHTSSGPLNPLHFGTAQNNQGAT